MPMILELAHVLPIQSVTHRIAWRGQESGQADSRATPVVFDMGASFLSAYLSDCGEAVMFALHPQTSVYKAQKLAEYAVNQFCN